MANDKYLCRAWGRAVPTVMCAWCRPFREVGAATRGRKGKHQVAVVVSLNFVYVKRGRCLVPPSPRSGSSDEGEEEAVAAHKLNMMVFWPIS